MVKLTANQRKALIEMSAKPWVNEYFMPKTVKTLISCGYAVMTFKRIGIGKFYRITDAGRAALERSEGSPCGNNVDKSS